MIKTVRKLQDIQECTGIKISDEQREMLEKYLRERDISKPVDNDMYSRINEEFGKTGKKEQLRKDWAQHYNLDEWPKYRDEMIGREGRLGGNYDLHHIIPRRYGGPNEWWNMIPAANPEAHQRGIHRSGGMFRKLFPKLKRR